MTLRSEAAVGTKYGRPGDPCVVVIFGASGDLTKRLLLPALYNLAYDGLLPHSFALIGTARTHMDHESFRDQMSTDIRQFTTRDAFDERVWDELSRCLYYMPANFEDPAAYQGLARLLDEVDVKHKTQGNHLFYLAVPPVVFSMISRQLGLAGLAREEKGRHPEWEGRGPQGNPPLVTRGGSDTDRTRAIQRRYQTWPEIPTRKPSRP